MFNYGDIVRVRAFRDEILTRRVVGDNGRSTVYLCNEFEFQAAKQENREPGAVGFPVSDILDDDKRRAREAAS